MADPIYVYAEIGRAGLGNNLLPWARAELFAREHGLPRIAPIWFHLKFGPILRGEKDWRWYQGLFRHPGEIGGLRRWWILKRARITDESKAVELLAAPPATGRPQVIAFRFYSFGNWIDKGFQDIGEPFVSLLPHAQFLNHRLHEIVRPKHLRVVNSALNDVGPFIGVHYRRGDKPPLNFGDAYPTDTNHPTLPVEWYVGALKSMRQHIGRDLPAVVFTDGGLEQTKPLLDLPNVRLAPQGNNAIVDLLLMARSRAFVSTFSSSFSLWAAMLAQCPSVHYPGRPRHLVDGRPEMTVSADLTGAIPDNSGSVFANVFRDP